jgi:16S rRNA (uracil1498-N3)-methyltransferase
MPHRYFSETPLAGQAAPLSGAEAHHLLHVLRARPGDEVVLFDGLGAEFQARVEKTGRSSVELALLSKHEIDRELPIELTMGVALPKGDRQKWLVEKLTELGVHRLVPLETQRGVAQPVSSALDRLRRSVVEASKQCGRNRLMEVTEAQTLAAFLSQSDKTGARWFAHPSGLPLRQCFLQQQAGQRAAGISIAIGPEGGFADDEVSDASTAGWQTVGLGDRILRIETAAALLAAVSSLLCE